MKERCTIPYSFCSTAFGDLWRKSETRFCSFVLFNLYTVETDCRSTGQRILLSIRVLSTHTPSDNNIWVK